MPPPGPITAALKTRPQYTADSPIEVLFELTNVSNMDLYVLSWLTPLEGLFSDCLKVVRDRRDRVEYDGPMLKRGQPRADDYILVLAGQTIHHAFQLGRAYDVSQPGQYEIALDTVAHAVMPQLPAGLPASLNAKRVTDIDQPLVGGDAQFVVVRPPAGPSFKTLGELARDQERQFKTAAPASSGTGATTTGALAALVTGGGGSEPADTTQAHQDGYDLCEQALNDLNSLGTSDPRYVTWFGAVDPTRFQEVKDKLDKIKSAMESSTFTYDLSRTGCRSGTYAYTYKGTTTIYMCDLFFQAPATGTDSKAGTVVHEHSHATARTDDHAYGQIAAQKLAQNDPAKAVQNADNYEYYARG